jgi:hypothetical protein
MSAQNLKIKLSPRLQLGVGRRSSRRSLLPYATLIFFAISAVLGIRAGYMIFHRSPTVLTEQQQNSPQVLGAKDSPLGQQLFTEWTVKSGDTVFSIAQKHGVSWTTLATLNGLDAPFTLQVGQVIKVPKP